MLRKAEPRLFPHQASGCRLCWCIQLRRPSDLSTEFTKSEESSP